MDVSLEDGIPKGFHPMDVGPQTTATLRVRFLFKIGVCVRTGDASLFYTFLRWFQVILSQRQRYPTSGGGLWRVSLCPLFLVEKQVVHLSLSRMKGKYRVTRMRAESGSRRQFMTHRTAYSVRLS